jgi:cold shock CspA family protein
MATNISPRRALIGSTPAPQDVFVHISAAQLSLGDIAELKVGERYQFTEEIDPRTGKTRAANLRAL